jgi:hypothetical protein
MILPLMAASSRGQSGRWIAGAALLVLLLLVQAAGVPSRAQEADPFSATVKVDARADTAAKARDAARIDGQRRALAAIAERLSGGAPARPPKLDDRTITDLVASFEVANERMSAVRYMADYTFHFRPAETRRALGVTASAPESAKIESAKIESAKPETGQPLSPPTARQNAAEISARPIVIVPVYQEADQTVLWDDPNPWREAWEYAPAIAGRAVVPLGDAGDLAAIDADKARAGDSDAIASLTRRNGGDTAVVALASLQGPPDRPTALDVRLRRYRDGRLVDTRSKGFSANPGESAADLLRRAAAAIAPDIGAGPEAGPENGIAQEPQAPPPAALSSAAPEPPPQREPQQSLTAVLPINSLDDWLSARERLRSVPAIRKVALAALSRQEATVAIDYTGTIEQLKSELAKISLDLVQRESRWRLARGAAFGAP